MYPRYPFDAMKQVITLVLLLLVQSLVFGQKPVFEQTLERNSIPIRRLQQADAPLNLILDTLREAKGVKNRGMLFVYDKTQRIVRDKDRLIFEVDIKNLRYIGNTAYRNFETADVLVPNMASFVIDWYQGEEQRLKSIFVKDASIDKESLRLISLDQVDSLKLDNYRINTKGFEFVFDDDNFLDFKSRIDVIDQFYVDFDSIVHRIETIKRNEFGMQRLRQDTARLLLASRFVYSTQNFIKEIREKGYESLTPAPGKPPVELFTKLSTLDYLNTRVLDSVQQVVHAQYERTAREIDRLIQTQDFTGAQRLVTQGLFPYGLESDGQYFLSLISYRQQQYALAHSRLVTLAQNYVISKELMAKCSKLSLSLARVYLDSSAVAARKNDFEQSYQDLQRVYQLFEHLPETKTLAAQHPPMRQQQQELFKLMSDYAQLQFTKGELQLAMDWFERTEELCEKFGLNLCDTQLAAKLTESKVEYRKKMIRSAIHSVETYDLQTAADQLEQIKAFAEENKLPATPLFDHAQQLWGQKACFQRLKEGVVASGAADHFTAIEKLLEVKTLARDYRLDIPDEIDTFLVVNANAMLGQFTALRDSSPQDLDPNDIGYLAELMTQIDAQVPDSCMAMLDMPADSLSSLVHLACRHKQMAYDRYVAQADTTIESTSFMQANELLQSAITLASEYESCQIDPHIAEGQKQRIEHGVGYELQLDRIHDEVQNYNYSEAIDLYNQLSEYHSIYRLDDLKLVHYPLQNFIVNTGDVGFVNFCIGQFSDMANVDMALFLLNHLYHKGINSDEARNGQIALGLILATKDYKYNSGRPVRDMIRNYTNGDAWFKHFEEVYSLQWQNLQNNK